MKEATSFLTALDTLDQFITGVATGEATSFQGQTAELVTAMPKATTDTVLVADDVDVVVGQVAPDEESAVMLMQQLIDRMAANHKAADELVAARELAREAETAREAARELAVRRLAARELAARELASLFDALRATLDRELKQEQEAAARASVRREAVMAVT